jgi:hypothetical protein
LNHPPDAYTCWPLFRQLFNSSSELRACALCGNYFSTRYTSNQQYCTRLYKDTGLTCSQYASRNNFKIKAKKNVMAAEYTRAYNQLYARIRTGKTPSKTPFMQALKDLHKEYQKKYDACTDESGKQKIYDEYASLNKKLLDREMLERAEG